MTSPAPALSAAERLEQLADAADKGVWTCGYTLREIAAALREPGLRVPEEVRTAARECQGSSFPHVACMAKWIQSLSQSSPALRVLPDGRIEGTLPCGHAAAKIALDPENAPACASCAGARIVSATLQSKYQGIAPSVDEFLEEKHGGPTVPAREPAAPEDAAAERARVIDQMDELGYTRPTRAASGGEAETDDDGRRKGHTRLVYNKKTRTIDKVPINQPEGEARAERPPPERGEAETTCGAREPAHGYACEEPSGHSGPHKVEGGLIALWHSAGEAMAERPEPCQRCGGSGYETEGDMETPGLTHHMPCPECNAPPEMGDEWEALAADMDRAMRGEIGVQSDWAPRVRALARELREADEMGKRSVGLIARVSTLERELRDARERESMLAPHQLRALQAESRATAAEAERDEALINWNAMWSQRDAMLAQLQREMTASEAAKAQAVAANKEADARAQLILAGHQRENALRDQLSAAEAALAEAESALAAERSIWCDKPEDRLYHAEDETWWRRAEDGRCVAADPPASVAAERERAEKLEREALGYRTIREALGMAGQASTGDTLARVLALQAERERAYREGYGDAARDAQTALANRPDDAWLCSEAHDAATPSPSAPEAAQEAP